MKKLLLGVLTIGAVGGVAMLATNAFFSDTETSSGNVLQAGAIDLLIDNTSYRTGPTGALVLSSETTWDAKNLAMEKFFNFTDLKPGDVGEDTISLRVENNDAWACAHVNITENSDNGYSEPEDSISGSSIDQNDGTPLGDLASELRFAFWVDDGDNVFESTEQILIQGLASDVLEDATLALAQPTGSALFGNSPLTGSQTYYIGKYYCYGSFTAEPLGPDNGSPIARGTGFSCDGAAVTDLSQTDKLTGDLHFYAIQSRNNPNFTCDSVQWPGTAPTQKTLTLENANLQGDPWTPITDDSIQGLLTWAGDGPTFNYSVTAQGLPASTEYSLIYYADPYPGNNPGKLIGTGTTDGSGNLAFLGNPNLGIDLPTSPDTNIVNHGGAKIWLIPSANYNAGTNSVEPWAPNTTTWLFEGNVYINYNDTDN